MIRLLPSPVKALTACITRSRISDDLAPEQTTTAPVYSPRRFGSSESSAYTSPTPSIFESTAQSRFSSVVDTSSFFPAVPLPDDLADYIEHPEQSPLREGWRFELVGSRLDDLLSGNMGLTVKDGKIELL